MAKPRGLFIAQAKAKCSIYESSRMMFDCLKLSEKYDIEFREASTSNFAVEPGFDFYVFNYHHATLKIDAESLKAIPAPKFTFVLEVNPGDPFVLCPPGVFDAYMPLDPSMVHPDKSVFPFPRPVEPAIDYVATLPEIPVIGSFGFGTPGKGFEQVIHAVNKEFDRAKVRINIPHGTFTKSLDGIVGASYPEFIADICKKSGKPGVEVEVTHDYMSNEDLIKWCAENTLNCFLYTRNQPGLSATTDQAISSGRPLAIGTNPTFRHIHPYITPFPYRSLKESIEQSTPEVLQMRSDWAAKKFAERFEEVLVAKGLLSIDRPVVELRSTKQTKKTTVLLVNHPQKQCGIHQYGEDIAEVMQQSLRYDVKYAECSNQSELFQAVSKSKPKIVFYNYYPATMPWLRSSVTRLVSGIPIGLMHEVTQAEADSANKSMFDYHICPDPTLVESNESIIKIPRLIPRFTSDVHLSGRLRIGTFGFAFPDKGFVRLVERVQEEFDEADIIIHSPSNSVVAVSTEVLNNCNKAIRKPGVRLLVNTEFVTRQQLLAFLAGNDLNVFLYDQHKHRGISSAVEKALASGRPVAVSKSLMFRHVHDVTPSICVEDRSLKDIINSGTAPLGKHLFEWSEPMFVKGIEEAFDRALRVP